MKLINNPFDQLTTADLRLAVKTAIGLSKDGILQELRERGQISHGDYLRDYTLQRKTTGGVRELIDSPDKKIAFTAFRELQARRTEHGKDVNVIPTGPGIFYASKGSQGHKLGQVPY